MCRAQKLCPSLLERVKLRFEDCFDVRAHKRRACCFWMNWMRWLPSEAYLVVLMAHPVSKLSKRLCCSYVRSIAVVESC